MHDSLALYALFTLMAFLVFVGMLRWAWLVKRGRAGSPGNVFLNGLGVAAGGFGLMILYAWLFVP